VASETHFPLARVLECPRQSWLDQDDGRIGPDHSSDLVSGTGIPRWGLAIVMVRLRYVPS
jgi:hypothetical protein